MYTDGCTQEPLVKRGGEGEGASGKMMV